MNKSVYTTPKLCASKTRWYVHFRYQGVQKRYNVPNKEKDASKRQQIASALVKALHDKLKKGWNPLTNVQSPTMVMFADALDFALEKKKPYLAKKTHQDYACTVRFVKQALKPTGMNITPIAEVKRSDIKRILHYIKSKRNWSNKAFNKNLNCLKAVISELLEWDILEYNIAHKIKPLKQEVCQSNPVPNEAEMKQIKSHLKENYPEFFVFVATVFHTGIRPGELLKVTLSMLDLEAQTFTLPSVITKSNRYRIVPINNHLMELFNDMDLHNYPDDFYLFGSYRQSGRGNVGKHLDFIPGFTKIKTDTTNRRWRKAIKQELGLEVNLYAMKHAGADAKIRSGIDLDVLRELYGHSSTKMTERYARGVKEVYRNEIIKRSPRF